MAPSKIAVWIDSVEKIRVIFEVALVKSRNGVIGKPLRPYSIWIAEHSEIGQWRYQHQCSENQRDKEPLQPLDQILPAGPESKCVITSNPGKKHEQWHVP